MTEEAFGGEQPPNRHVLPATYADVAMFQAESFLDVDLTTGVVPSVKLLWMTPDPMGAIASMAAMYEGHVIRDLSDVSDASRMRYFKDVCKTHLDTPLEAVKFQFLLEGVDRATTHQVVRARHQTYAQESLRFAVVDELAGGTSLPPSLWGTDPDTTTVEMSRMSPEEIARHEQRREWDEVLRRISDGYAYLIDHGMPAEEARGLLPHATATRMVVVTDLRSLKAEAGNRLCTQAQFHWRILFNGIVSAIREYRPYEDADGDNLWQFQDIADSPIFRPVCYQIGKCPFKASFDRACSIRERVDIRAKNGSTDSSEWHKVLLFDHEGEIGRSEGIQTEEWLLDPSAARRRAK